MDPEDLLRNFYAALNERDLTTLLNLLAPDVEWPDQLEGGTLHGVEEVEEYWRQQWKLTNTRLELIHVVMDPNGHAVATVKETSRERNADILSETQVRHQWEFANGLVKRLRILP